MQEKANAMNDANAKKGLALQEQGLVQSKAAYDDEVAKQKKRSNSSLYGFGVSGLGQGR
jgi:hypothetical protein